MKRPFHGLLAPALLTLAACAPATRVVLLPQEGVPTAAVEVQSQSTHVVMAKPYHVIFHEFQGGSSVPSDIEGLRGGDPALGRRWRLAAREVFGALFGAGFRPVGIDADGHYVFVKGA